MTRSLRAVCVLAIALSCTGGAKQGSDETIMAGVGTAVVTQDAFPQTVNAIGMIAARPGHYAALAPPGPTRVARIFAVAGQRVRRGDPIVEFEHAPFDAAAQSAAATLANAERADARAQRLVQAGILPQKDADQAAADLAAAQSAAVTARRAQELATLRAPLAGVVTRMSAVLGESVDAGQTLVEVADPTALDVVFNVSPAEAARIQVRDTVYLRIGEATGADDVGSAEITSVALAVDSASRAVAIHARLIESSPARALRIGESVAGHIVTGVHANATIVPLEALVPDGEGFRVYVVDSAGIAHARTVRVGARSETRAEITDGLVAGETVVTTGAYGVTDSARVRASAP